MSCIEGVSEEPPASTGGAGTSGPGGEAGAGGAGVGGEAGAGGTGRGGSSGASGATGTGGTDSTCRPGYTGKNCEVPRLLGCPIVSGFEVLVDDISGDGTVVAGTIDAGTGDDVRAYRWVTTSDTLTSLPKGDPTTATGVSFDGEYWAGVLANAEGVHAVRWDAALDALKLPNPSQTTYFVFSMSGDGTTLVGGHDRAAFIWNVADSYGTDITTSTFLIHYFNAVSGDGKIAAGIGTLAGLDHPIWWSSDSGIVELPGGGGQALDISSDGKVIVGLSGAPTRWTGPGFTTRDILPLLPTWASQPKGWVNSTSHDGSVSVGASDTTNAYAEAALWTGGTVQKISDILSAAGADLSGWTLDEARAISDDGKIVLGVGRYDGSPRCWVVGLP